MPAEIRVPDQPRRAIPTAGKHPVERWLQICCRCTWSGWNLRQSTLDSTSIARQSLRRWKKRASSFHAERGFKVRVLLERCGALTLSHTPVEQEAGDGKVIISDTRVFSGDRFLRHKTTRRQLYDAAIRTGAPHGYDEVLFLNERGEVTEGAISNVFIEVDGRWFTPPVSCGLLPGIYRRHLLETRPATETSTAAAGPGFGRCGLHLQRRARMQKSHGRLAACFLSVKCNSP